MVSFLIALLMVKPLKRSTQKEWQSGAGNNDGACNGVTVMAEVLGQTVPIPPKWTTSEQVTLLLNNASPSCQLLTTRFLIYANNNVLPLRLGDKETLLPMRFEGSKAYYFHARLKELGLNHRQWSLCYRHGKADFYEGNKGAAQLILAHRSH
jgi:hypothetical protein